MGPLSRKTQRCSPTISRHSQERGNISQGAASDRHLTEPRGGKRFQSIALDNERDMKSSNLSLILIQWHEAVRKEGRRETEQTFWTAKKTQKRSC